MKFEKTGVWGFEHAFRGMRNPMNSWNKSDSNVLFDISPNFEQDDKKAEKYIKWNNDFNFNFKIGEEDLKLAQKLIKAGSEHRKFMRQIFVSVDITAALFWWKEMSTYKIGTTANSTSTMHKLANTQITIDCFETDDYEPRTTLIDDQHLGVRVSLFLEDLEQLRQKYLQTNDKRYWKELIRWLPESWLQTRTITMSYENLYNIIKQRTGHKLTEWHQFIDWCKTLPYAEELLFI